MTMTAVVRRPPPPPTAAPAKAATLRLGEHDVVIPASALTLAGFRAWAASDDFPERGRVCFLGDEVFIDMSPEEIETHLKLKGEIAKGMLLLVEKEDLGEFYCDGVLITHPTAGLSCEPDASFVTWEDLASGRVRSVPREGVEGQYIEIEGTPRWVLEIVSNSSVGKDTRKLRDLYYQAGVAEYWIIDARGADILFQILVRGESEYVEVAPRRGWVRSQVFDRRFRLTRTRGRLKRWKYRLEARR
jgi:Uma2 family endonuclease